MLLLTRYTSTNPEHKRKHKVKERKKEGYILQLNLELHELNGKKSTKNIFLTEGSEILQIELYIAVKR